MKDRCGWQGKDASSRGGSSRASFFIFTDTLKMKMYQHAEKRLGLLSTFSGAGAQPKRLCPRLAGRLAGLVCIRKR